MPDSSNEMVATFGELLRYLRRRMQMTQQELGIALGYSIAMIARLENGERLPDLGLVKTTYIEALGLQHEPALATQLIALATAARGEKQTAPDTRVSLHDAQRSNLPRQLTHFVGRQHELAEVARLLDTNPLVTLTGSGGVGKTRLAVEAGVTLRGQFTDGVWLADLAPLADPALIPQTVAKALDIPELPGAPSLEALTAFLKAKHLLLILDNCEHLIDVCGQLVETILRACLHIRILTTCREPLRVAGEVVWRVPSLTTPDPANLPPLPQVLDYEAIELFVLGASAAQPGFTLSPDNLKAVAQICWRLDGIPLAIEMAAAQVSALPVGDVAAGLDDQFSLLTMGMRTVLPRQHTMRATLDWSYDLLEERERILLARLSVFAGGWRIDAARAVTADLTSEPPSLPKKGQLGISKADILPVLLQLVHKSLVVSMTRDGQVRYRYVETVRQYAKERLETRGEMKLVSDRHLAYYLALAGQTTDLGGRHVEAWVAQVEPEYDNMRAAFTWARTCAGEDQGESMLRLAAALRPFRHYRGFYAEGMAWLDEALARGMQAPAAARAWALLAKATIVANQLGPLQVDDWMRASAELFEQTDDRAGQAWSLEGMVTLAVQEGVASGEAQAERALGLFLDLGSQAGMGRVLRTLGSYAFRRGDHRQARHHYLEAFQIAQQIGDIRVMISSLDLLTQLNPGEAIDACEYELVQLRQEGSTEHLAEVLCTYGDMLLTRNEYARASSVLIEAVSLWQTLGHHGSGYSMTGEIGATLLLGIAAWALGKFNQAIDHSARALQLAQEVGTEYGVLFARFNLAAAILTQGKQDEAASLLRDLLRELYDIRNGVTLPECTLVFVLLAELARQRGNLARAARLLGVSKADAFMVDNFPRMLHGITSWWRLSTRLSGYESTCAEVLAQMDDIDFDTLWAEGHTMTLEQAIAYALEWGEAD